MELFRDLDEFFRTCQQLQTRLDKLDTQYAAAVPNGLEQVKDVRERCEEIRPVYQRLDKQLSELRSQYFSNEVRDIQAKFDQVENVYLHLLKVAEGRIAYLSKFLELEIVLAKTDSELDAIGDRLREQRDGRESDYLKQELRQLCVRFVHVVADVQKLNQWPSEGAVTLLQPTGESYSLNQDAENILRKAERLWREHGPPSESLSQLVTEYRTLAEREVALQKAYELAQNEMQQAQQLARETRIEKMRERHGKLRKLSSNLEEKLAELERTVQLSEQFSQQSDNPPPSGEHSTRRLHRQWSELFETVKSEEVRTVTHIRTREVIAETVQSIRPVLQKATHLAGLREVPLQEIEEYLENLNEKERQLQVARRESLALPPEHSNLVERELQEVEKEWSRVREVIERMKQEILAKRIANKEIEDQLKQLNNWVRATEPKVRQLRNDVSWSHNGRAAPELRTLNSELDKYSNFGNSLAQQIDQLPSSDAQVTRIRFLEQKGQMVQIEDSLYELSSLVEKLEEFEGWVEEFVVFAKNTPRATDTAAEKWEIYNTLKYHYDIGKTREVTAWGLKDKQPAVPSFAKRIQTVLDKYYAALKSLLDDYQNFEGYAKQHDDFDRLMAKFGDTADWIDKDLASIELHRSLGYKLTHEKLLALDKSIEDIETLRIVEKEITVSVTHLKAYTNQTGTEKLHTGIRKAHDVLQNLDKRAKALRTEGNEAFKSLEDISSLLVDVKDSVQALQGQFVKAQEMRSTLQEKRENLELLMHLRETISKLSPKIEKLERAIPSNDETFSVRAKPVIAAYGQLRNRVEQQIEIWKTYVDDHAKYEKLMKEYLFSVSELENKEKMLRGYLNQGDPNLDYKAHFNDVQTHIDALKTQHWQLGDLTRPLTTATSKAGRDSMRNELRMLRDDLQQYQAELDRLETAHRELQSAQRQPQPAAVSTVPTAVPRVSLATGSGPNYSLITPPDRDSILSNESGFGDTSFEQSPLTPQNYAHYRSLSTIEEVSSTVTTLSRGSDADMASTKKDAGTIKVEMDLANKTEAFERWLKDFEAQLKTLELPKGASTDIIQSKLSKAKSLQTQKPVGDQLLQNWITAFQSARNLPVANQQKWAHETNKAKTAWSDACNALGLAVARLNEKQRQTDKLKEYRNELDKQLHVMAKVLAEKSDNCKDFQAKESRLATLKALLVKVSQARETLQAAEAEKAQLVHAGLVPPQFDGHSYAAKLQQLDKAIQDEVERWLGIVESHNEFESHLSMFQQWVERKLPLVREFQREELRTKTELDARVHQLEDMRKQGTQYSQNTGERLPGALQHMSAQGSATLRSAFERVRHDWLMLQKEITELLESLQHSISRASSRSEAGSMIDYESSVPETPRRSRTPVEMMEPSRLDQQLLEEELARSKLYTKSEKGKRSFSPFRRYKGKKKKDGDFENEPLTPPEPTPPMFQQRPSSMVIEDYSSAPAVRRGRSSPLDQSQESTEGPAEEFIYIRGRPDKTRRPFIDWKLGGRKLMPDDREYDDDMGVRRQQPVSVLVPDIDDTTRTDRSRLDEFTNVRFRRPERYGEELADMEVVPPEPDVRTDLLTRTNVITEYDGYISYGDVYYEDRFVRLTPSKLLIKTYFFPFFLPKTVHLGHIKAVYYDKSGPFCMRTPVWGCGAPLGVWWACNAGRGWNEEDYANCVIHTGEHSALKAFSVRNVAAFVRLLRSTLSSKVAFIAGLPD